VAAAVERFWPAASDRLRRLARERQAQPVPIDNGGDKAPAAQSQVATGAANLRHVADCWIAASRQPAEHADRAAACRHQAQDGAHQRRLAGAVRSEHPDKLAVPISRLTSASTSGPANLSATSRNSIAFTGLLLGERPIDRVKHARHPALIVLAGGLGFRGPHHRDPRRLGNLLHPIGNRVRGLAIVDQKFALMRLESAPVKSAKVVRSTPMLVSESTRVGVGLGLQRTVSNLFSGIVLLLDKSIKPGDVIEVGGTYGWVSSLGARYVSVETRDGTEFLIPNEDIITQQVVNWSHKSDRVRLKVPVRVPHDSDLDQALALMREAASYPERVLAVPAPNALIMAFGETAIELELRFWIEDAQNGVHNVKSQVLYEIWRLFRQQGIRIPYPKRDLYVRSDAPASFAEAGDRGHRRS